MPVSLPIQLRNLRFVGLALLLSISWYPILLLIPTHRDFIRSAVHDPTGVAFGMGQFEFILLLCVAGLTVSLIFRPLIVGGNRLVTFALGCGLPYLAAALFLTLFSVDVSIRTGSFDEFMVPIFWMLYTLFWFPLIAAIGIAMEFALRWAGRA